MTSATTNTRQTGLRGRTLTPAQIYCYVIGATLLVVGIIGFFVDSGFNTGDELQGDELILFEVNGIHNIVHLASGLVLLALAPRRPSARIGALGFGLVYGVVTIIGFIDGSDVLGLIPVNTADNFLHLALSAAGILAGIAPSPDDRRREPEAERTDRAVERSGRFDRSTETSDQPTELPRR